MTEAQQVNANKTFRDVMIAICAAIVNIATALPFTGEVDYLVLGKQIVFQAVLVFAFRYLRENKIDSTDFNPNRKND